MVDYANKTALEGLYSCDVCGVIFIKRANRVKRLPYGQGILCPLGHELYEVDANDNY